MIHIVNTPTDLEWKTCTHKPTVQRYAILDRSATIETAHGTMVGWPGCILIEGVNKQLYVLSPESFLEVYNT